MKEQTESPERQSQYSAREVTDKGCLFEIGSAYAYFERVKDKLKARGRQHPLAEVLTVCLLRNLSGENTLASIAGWAKSAQNSCVTGWDGNARS